MFERLGGDVKNVAGQRADEMFAQGDSEGQLAWQRIIVTINEIQRTELAANERRH
ncbi:MAG: hypothetical protein ACRDFS_07380 [Chloroflexota bacterium]